MKRHTLHANGSEFADSAVSNVVATFRRCLSPIVSKLSTYPGISKKNLTDSLVPGALHWWAGLATIDRLLTVSLVVGKL